MSDLIRLERARCRALIQVLDEIRRPIEKIKSPSRGAGADEAASDARLLELTDRIEAGLMRAMKMLESELRSDLTQPDLQELVRSLYVRKDPTRGNSAATPSRHGGRRVRPVDSRDGTTAAEIDRPSTEQSFDTTVLVVDDHAGTRAFLRHAIGKHHEVIEAENGEEALRLAQTHRPDLVLSDIMMPGMDGNELCRAIKSDSTLGHTPVFLITANTVRSLRTEGLASGADDYLVKPLDVKEAVMRINNEIRSRAELRRRYRREVVIKPSNITVTPEDEAFVNKAREVVEQHMSDAQFSVQALASQMHLSARQLQRRLRETVDQSPVEFMRSLRLQRAAQLLEARYGNVSEVAYSVGFTSLSYFAKCFKEEYGVSPSGFKERAS